MSKKLKTRYSDNELEEFKALIDQKLVQGREQLKFYQDQLKDRSENPDAKLNGMDNSIGAVETERLLNLSSRQIKHIKYLENALLRIQNKVFGICRVTGNLISKERLKAVPHATLSIDAKLD